MQTTVHRAVVVGVCVRNIRPTSDAQLFTADVHAASTGAFMGTLFRDAASEAVSFTPQGVPAAGDWDLACSRFEAAVGVSHPGCALGRGLAAALGGLVLRATSRGVPHIVLGTLRDALGRSLLLTEPVPVEGTREFVVRFLAAVSDVYSWALFAEADPGSGGLDLFVAEHY